MTAIGLALAAPVPYNEPDAGGCKHESATPPSCSRQPGRNRRDVIRPGPGIDEKKRPRTGLPGIESGRGPVATLPRRRRGPPEPAFLRHGPGPVESFLRRGPGHADTVP